VPHALLLCRLRQCTHPAASRVQVLIAKNMTMPSDEITLELWMLSTGEGSGWVGTAAVDRLTSLACLRSRLASGCEMRPA